MLWKHARNAIVGVAMNKSLRLALKKQMCLPPRMLLIFFFRFELSHLHLFDCSGFHEKVLAVETRVRK